MLLEIGRIARAQGLRGECMVDLVTDRLERLDPGSVLATDLGPLTVVSAQHHQRQRWIVRFEGVDDRTAAERLHGLLLRAEPLDDPDELWVHELVGAEVVERDGTSRGRVEAVQENPAHDLLVLDTGSLVPVVFVVEHAPGRVVVEVPDGLFDLD